MNILAEIKDDQGQVFVKFNLPPKEFKTGSRGFYAHGRTEIDGKRYQVQVQLVEVGSKKKAEGT